MAGRFELVAYRCTIDKYARKLDGAGAARGSHNRWNASGESVTYTASSRALALLETRVHSLVGPPHGAVFSVVAISLPAEEVSRITAAELPEGWRDPYDVGHCQIRGSKWYSDDPKRKLLIVPSVVVPAEDLYVIRGGLSESEATVIDVEPIMLDPRLWESAHIDKGVVLTLQPAPGA